LLIEKTTLAPANAALVFGNAAICGALANEVANYYHQGYFPHIVITGGILRDQIDPEEQEFLTEAESIERHLLARGVPKECIFKEELATNTQQNVINCKALFNENAALQGAESIISFGNIKASRRFLMTLKANWPEVFAMQVGVNAFHHPAPLWHENEYFRGSVLGQYERLDEYIKNGWIKEVDIDEINKKAELLRFKF
jgi:uncharacterized SAM-binding protein YcdF (DUF218 family)